MARVKELELLPCKDGKGLESRCGRWSVRLQPTRDGQLAWHAVDSQADIRARCRSHAEATATVLLWRGLATGQYSADEDEDAPEANGE